MLTDASSLRDLWHHHAWADAEHWRAFTALPGALEDQVLFERLYHLHLTQSAWVWAIGDRRDGFVMHQVTDFVPAATLKAFAIEQHASLDMLAAADESALDRRLEIPWFDNLQVTLREGLTQVAMHSHYHRGQNASRFRELGGQPPGTDLITWISKGRPSAQWMLQPNSVEPFSPDKAARRGAI